MAINLSKGQKIDLTKKDAAGNTSALTDFCVGVNWGVIEKPGFLGMGKKKVAVDLDASCVLLNEQKQVLDVVYFGQLRSRDGSIVHSGDDRQGDVDGDDGLDNEVIQVDVSRVDAHVDQIVFFINSFERQDFATVPFAKIRLYEGTPQRVNNVVANFDIATDQTYAGYVTMIMGKLYRRNGEWKFAAIGEPTRDDRIEHTVQTIVSKYS